MTTPGRIIDVSSNNHPATAPIAWPAVAAAGVTTAFVKATQGTTYVNPWFARDVAGAQAAGLDVLAYHYATWATAAAEAAFFASAAGTLAAALDGEGATTPAWVNAFFTALGRMGARGIYYGGGAALSTMHPAPATLLWGASWGAPLPSTVAVRAVAWQFTNTASVPGCPSLVDESRWIGSQATYDALFAKLPPPTPLPPPPTPDPPVPPPPSPVPSPPTPGPVPVPVPPQLEGANDMGVAISTGTLAVTGVSKEGRKLCCTVPLAESSDWTKWSVMDVGDVAVNKGVIKTSQFVE